MMNKSILLCILIFIATISRAQTWSEQIAPVIYNNCSNCHNANGIAPFTLMNYQDAVINGNDIKDAVMDKIMPPWPPDPSYNRLAHERILSQQQIDDISNWVDNGMPRGDSLLEPAAPVFNTAAEITNPDMILSAPVFNVTTSDDLYRCFVVPSNLSADKYLTAIEAIPGNRNIVHHILIYSDTSMLPLLYDAADPGPGYTNIAGTGSLTSKLIGAWVPGQTAFYTPSGMGIRLPANTNIIMQIHYPAGVTSQVDSSKLLFKVTPNPVREINIETPLNHYQLDNGPLYIPANTVKTFYAHYTVPYDLSALSVGPHMHLVGTSIRSFGITSAGDTIPFIDIPHWNFHWQGYYAFPRILKIPAGTTIFSEATYDNTTANPDNPNSPPQNVSLGESTTDEMMLVYFAYTTYMPGDENIIQDSAFFAGTQVINNAIVSTLQLYEPSPNPVINNLTFQYFLPKTTNVKISVLDLHGKLISEKSTFIGAGISTSNLSVSNLPAGIYFLKLEADGIFRSKKFMKD